MIYCYKCQACGCTAEVHKIMAEVDRPELCPNDSFVMARDYPAENGRPTTGNWPLESDAMGVAPDQVLEATKEASAMGVPTEFNKNTGAAIFTSRRHRKDFCKEMGVHDRNGGYSDP